LKSAGLRRVVLGIDSVFPLAAVSDSFILSTIFLAVKGSFFDFAKFGPVEK